MKIRVSFCCLFILLATSAFSQEPADALRYSYLTGEGGTARAKGVGNAVGALGGEFSTLFVNPAGIGFNKTGDFVVTPNYWIKKTNAEYLGNSATATKNKFNLGTTGVMFSSSSRRGKVENVTIGIGINRMADFNNHIFYSGVNTNSSYSEKYLETLIYGNVTDPNDAATLFPYGASLALNTYLIDTIAGAGGAVEGYRSLANPAYGLLQEMDIMTSGGIIDASLGVGVNLEDKWYFGGTLSFPFLHYVRNANYRESDQSGDGGNYFNFFEANEELETKGVGINGKLGMIFTPNGQLRLGLAVHTPTFYQLTDLYNMQIVTELEGYAGPGQLTLSSTDLNEGDFLRSRYNLTTPWRAILSGSYIINNSPDVSAQNGFITADIEYVDYTASAFHAVNNDAEYSSYYETVNEAIDNLYTTAINVRLGGEMKFNTFMVRLGGAYYGSPYKEDNTKSVTNISGGIGYRDKGMYVDLSYTHSMSKSRHFPYLLQDKENVAANLKGTYSNIALTLGFKL